MIFWISKDNMDAAHSCGGHIYRL